MAPLFLTSALDGGEWSASRHGRFSPGKSTADNYWIVGWNGLRADLDAMENRKTVPPQEIEPRPSCLLPIAVSTEVSWLTKFVICKF
jgi:hypothetical protein